MNLTKKIMLGVIMITLFTFISITLYASEVLTINGEKVKYYKTNTEITIPDEYEYNLFEMRGMWVATVWNGDFRTSSTVTSYKSQFNKILDSLEANNFNTILFQIRPSNDAFYVSEINPWSEWMTGTQGRDIKDVDGKVFDPLAWMIEETHRRGMRFMGWMNAYRISARTLYSDSSNNYTQEQVTTKVNNTIDALSDINFAKKNKKYVLLGDSDAKIILNPGEGMVRNHIVKSIQEIVTNYDIDGVHFDDYFYLDSTNSSYAEKVVNNLNDYLQADTAFNDYYNDYETYMTNRLPNETLAAFRRRSVNLMISSVSDMIKNVNKTMGKHVEFGSKPAAVWTAKGRDISGRVTGANVTTYSYSSYFDIFADSLYWAEQGWVDWIAPQVYFNFCNNEVPYADIVKWWAETISESNKKLKANGKKEVKLYIAHGVYRMSTSEPLEKRITDATEVNKQLLFNKNFDSIAGSSFYDYSTFNGSTTLIKETRANLKLLWDKKTIPYKNDETCDLMINQITIDKENKKIIIEDNNCKAYIIYKCDKKEDCSSSTVYDVVYNHSTLESTIDDCDATYFVQGCNEDYALSTNFYKVSNDTEYIPIDLYIGDKLEIDKSYNLVSISNTDIINYENGILTSKQIGKAIVEFVSSDKTVIYICNALEIKYFNVYITEDIGYTLKMNQSEKVREGTDIVFTLELKEGYTDSKPKIKINNFQAPITNTYTYHNIQTDLNISIMGIEKNIYYVTVKMGDQEQIITVKHGENCELPTPINIEGKEFDSWTHDGTNICESMVIRGIYTDITYIVTFDVKGGKSIDSTTVLYNNYLTETIPTKKGYKFIGWYLDTDYTQMFSYDEVIKNNITLYAKWEETSGCQSQMKIYNFLFTIPLLLGIILRRKKY